MPDNRIALIADVHGNFHALEAVLRDIERRQITTIINLGDHLHGLLNPRETADRLMSLNMVSLSGNKDRLMVEPDEKERSGKDFSFLNAQLETRHFQWLREMPKTAVVGEIFCCHGTPQSDEGYLLEDVTAHGVFLRSNAGIQSFLEGVAQPVIACAHTHIARLVHLPDGRMVVNPGSVGVPAYADVLPYPHSMESGSPHARYAIVSADVYGPSVEFVALAYPWFEPAELARERGRPDRARWIETGRV